MNKKVLSEPKTMADLVTYWAWKRMDLVRVIVNLQLSWNSSPASKRADLSEKIMCKIAERKLIESLQRRHEHGAF